METLVSSRKITRILTSTTSQLDNTAWALMSAAVQQLRYKANTVAHGHGKFGHKANPIIPPTKRIKYEEYVNYA